MKFAESTVEEGTLEWFQELGYDYRPGREIAHDGLFAKRKGSSLQRSPHATFIYGRAFNCSAVQG